MPDTAHPLIYLDQNILDLLVKAKSDWLEKIICEKGDVFYSDETLAEIYRCGSYAPKFVEVLEKMNARHLQLITDEKGKQIGPQATLIDVPVIEKYQEFEQKEQTTNNDSQHLMDMMFKMFGGLNDESFSDIANRQFSDLKESMAEIETNQESSEIEVELAKLTSSMLEAIRENATRALPESDEQMQVAAMREMLGLGPVELNNIKGPNVIEQIFEKAKEKSPDESVGIEEMMSIKSDPTDPNRELLPQEKVRNIYMFLNMIGFFPDSKMNKERGFRRASSDVEHACVAPFAHILMSGDYAFVRKCAAAFEYLSLPTAIMHFDINSKDGTIQVAHYSPGNQFVGEDK